MDRRFSWDCLGLPVEYEIDKTIGIKSPAQDGRVGIQCRVPQDHHALLQGVGGEKFLGRVYNLF